MALIKQIREKRLKEVLDENQSIRKHKHETLLSILSQTFDEQNHKPIIGRHSK